MSNSCNPALYDLSGYYHNSPISSRMTGTLCTNVPKTSTNLSTNMKLAGQTKNRSRNTLTSSKSTENYVNLFCK